MARTMFEPAREVPIIAEADVVVAGGGPGGLVAAIAAARQGARTILVERYGFLGGLATAGLVSPILGHVAYRSHTPIVEGILREMTERMAALGGSMGWEESLQYWGINFDAEAFKIVADEMVTEMGVELLLHTWVADVVAVDGFIQAILVESKSGRGAIAGKVFVDGTGDADLIARAHLPYTQGRDFDNAVQSSGSFFWLAGIPKLDDEAKKAAMEIVRQHMADGDLSFYNYGFLGQNTAHRDFSSPNMTRTAGDPTDVRVLTQGELKVRRDVWKLLDVLRKKVPGFQDAYILLTSPQVGARESRQLRGRYTLTGPDITSAMKSEEGVSRSSYWVDIHCPLGHTYPVHLCLRTCPRGEKCPFWAAEHEHMYPDIASTGAPAGEWCHIPYGCLIPQGDSNVLVAGRSISATHEAMAAARVMGTCMGIGEATGVAAAMAVQGDGNVGHVSVPELRKRLAAQGALV